MVWPSARSGGRRPEGDPEDSRRVLPDYQLLQADQHAEHLLKEEGLSVSAGPSCRANSESPSSSLSFYVFTPLVFRVLPSALCSSEEWTGGSGQGAGRGPGIPRKQIPIQTDCPNVISKIQFYPPPSAARPGRFANPNYFAADGEDDNDAAEEVAECGRGGRGAGERGLCEQACLWE